MSVYARSGSRPSSTFNARPSLTPRVPGHSPRVHASAHVETATLSEPPPPDKRCGWLRCVPTFWDASSRSCTEDAYIYTRGTNNRPHTKHLSRKLTKRVHSTYHPLATSYTTDALTAATQELAAHSKLVELQVEKGKIVPLSSCWQLS